MPYYKVDGEIYKYTEDWIEAIDSAEAKKKAEDLNGCFFDSYFINEISKEEYEENS